MSVLTHPAPGTYSLAGYGPRAPIDTPLGPSSTFHRGRDYSLGGRSFRVLAARGGIVRWAYHSTMGGNEVLIEHKVPGHAYFATRYGHLASIDPLVRPGAHVPAGQLLGMAGATGRTRGVHLHFEVLLAPPDGESFTQTDPDPYLTETEDDDMPLTPNQAAALEWLGAEDRRAAFDVAAYQVGQLAGRIGILDALPGVLDGGDDPAALADAIVEAVGDDLARDVVEAIAARLAATS